jgi:hypothetical protein
LVDHYIMSAAQEISTRTTPSADDLAAAVHALRLTSPLLGIKKIVARLSENQPAWSVSCKDVKTALDRLADRSAPTAAVEATADSPALNGVVENTHINDHVPELPFEICDEGGMGRVLRATRDFAPGDIVMEEEPLVVFSEENTSFASLRRACVSAIEEWKKTARMQLDWSTPMAADVCCALLNASEEVKVTWLAYLFAPDDGAVAAFRDLGQRVCSLPENMSSMSVEEFVRGLQAVRINGFQFMRTKKAIFETASLVAHSCSPNMQYKSLTGKLVQRAIRCIQRGDILTFSYLGNWGEMMPTVLRRDNLSKSKNFWCRCSRCLAEDRTRSLPCPSSGCKGVVLHSLLREDASEPAWKCQTCNECFFDTPLEDALDLFVTERMLLVKVPLLVAELDKGAPIYPAQVSQLLARLSHDVGTQHWCYNLCLARSVESIFHFGLQHHDQRATLQAFTQQFSFFRWCADVFADEPMCYSNQGLQCCNEAYQYIRVQLASSGLNSLLLPASFLSSAIKLVHQVEPLIELEYGDTDEDVLQLRRWKKEYCASCGKPAQKKGMDPCATCRARRS